MRRTAVAQETEVVAGGELEFQNYCAVCHGVDSKGRGVMSKFLTVRPADLTQITRKNGGTFRFGRSTASSMDGKTCEDTAHEICRFGVTASVPNPVATTRLTRASAGRLLGLVFYLQHIQE